MDDLGDQECQKKSLHAFPYPGAPVWIQIPFFGTRNRRAFASSRSLAFFWHCQEVWDQGMKLSWHQGICPLRRRLTGLEWLGLFVVSFHSSKSQTSESSDASLRGVKTGTGTDLKSAYVGKKREYLKLITISRHYPENNIYP